MSGSHTVGWWHHGVKLSTCPAIRVPQEDSDSVISRLVRFSVVLSVLARISGHDGAWFQNSMDLSLSWSLALEILSFFHEIRKRSLMVFPRTVPSCCSWLSHNYWSVVNQSSENLFSRSESCVLFVLKDKKKESLLWFWNWNFKVRHSRHEILVCFLELSQLQGLSSVQNNIPNVPSKWLLFTSIPATVFCKYLQYYTIGDLLGRRARKRDLHRGLHILVFLALLAMKDRNFQRIDCSCRVKNWIRSKRKNLFRNTQSRASILKRVPSRSICFISRSELLTESLSVILQSDL